MKLHSVHISFIGDDIHEVIVVKTLHMGKNILCSYKPVNNIDLSECSPDNIDVVY